MAGNERRKDSENRTALLHRASVEPDKHKKTGKLRFGRIENPVPKAQRMYLLMSTITAASDIISVIIRIEKLLLVSRHIQNILSNDGSSLNASGRIAFCKANWWRRRRIICCIHRTSYLLFCLIEILTSSALSIKGGTAGTGSGYAGKKRGAWSAFPVRKVGQERRELRV
jgi:hypothetical protein